MYLSEQIESKWAPVLEHADLAPISDPYKKAVTAVVLENQERALREEQGIMEATHANATGASVDNYDPILISLVRRALPNLMAYDVAGVQPMTGPTGLIFAMKSHYASQTGTEALFNEADLTSLVLVITLVQTQLTVLILLVLVYLLQLLKASATQLL